MNMIMRVEQKKREEKKAWANYNTILFIYFFLKYFLIKFKLRTAQHTVQNTTTLTPRQTHKHIHNIQTIISHLNKKNN